MEISDVEKMQANKDVEGLIKALKDEDSDVREKAAEGLGKIGDSRAVEALIRALKDEERDVRKAAAEALGKIGEPAVEPLIEALKDEDSDVREKAAWALGEIRDVRSVEPLRRALKDEVSGEPEEEVVAEEEEEIVEESGLPELSEVIEEELKKLSLGKILFNPPQEMKVGIKERVEVRIAKTITEDLTKRLRGRGVPQIEKIKVGTFMKVCLKGNNFNIEALSSEEQVVTDKDFTNWDWDVTPLKSGIQSLLLTVTVRIKIPGYGEEKKDYPVFEREIKVKVNLSYTIKKFIKDHWQWIITTIIGIGSGVIGWFLKKLWEYLTK